MAGGAGWDPRSLVEHFRLEPMPLEGGMFRRLWKGETGVAGRPAGSAIIVLLAEAHGTFSAMHRLPVDEVWHFYLGDPVDLLLLSPTGDWQLVRLGHDLAAGEQVLYPVPALTWMGARVSDGGSWSLYGCTMAPGFRWSDYEGGGLELCAAYPAASAHIVARCRPGAPLRHPPEQLDHDGADHQVDRPLG
jgi:hypothetical protein